MVPQTTADRDKALTVKAFLAGVTACVGVTVASVLSGHNPLKINHGFYAFAGLGAGLTMASYDLFQRRDKPLDSDGDQSQRILELERELEATRQALEQTRQSQPATKNANKYEQPPTPSGWPDSRIVSPTPSPTTQPTNDGLIDTSVLMAGGELGGDAW